MTLSESQCGSISSLDLSTDKNYLILQSSNQRIFIYNNYNLLPISEIELYAFHLLIMHRNTKDTALLLPPCLALSSSSLQCIILSKFLQLFNLYTIHRGREINLDLSETISDIFYINMNTTTAWFFMKDSTHNEIAIVSFKLADSVYKVRV